MEPKLTPFRLKTLEKIIKANGGGLSCSGPPGWAQAIQWLHGQGLVQGKAGQEYLVVHTSDGLDLYRNLQAKASTTRGPL